MNRDRERFALHAALFATLGNPVRHEVFHAICSGKCTAAELVPALGISPSNLSQHLSRLRQAGLVTRSRRDGQVAWEVADPRITRACALLDEVIRAQLQRHADALDRSLIRPPADR